jgi:hypothetical protein
MVRLSHFQGTTDPDRIYAALITREKPDWQDLKV